MDIPLGDWRPDISDLNRTFASQAKNVVPLGIGYGPVPSMQAYSASALAARAYGLFAGRKSAASWALYAGTLTKLYLLSGSSWSDASRLAGGNYNVSSTEFWRFAQFGTYVYATNVNDALQRIDVDSGTNFAAVGGSPPQARNIAVVGDFVVLSSLSSDPYKIHWSAINDPTGWTIGTSLSDVQTFGDGGRVAGVAGGEVGYVLQEYAIRRMRFQPGSDYVFTFERVVDGKGCVSPYGFVAVAGTVYFVAEDGLYSYSGQGLNPLGAQRVNDWFLDNADTSRLNQVMAFADPFRPRIYWAFYSSANSAYFDRVLAYDWSLDRFSWFEATAEVWGQAATPGIGLDSISGTLETLTTSFDSRSYEGGRLGVSAFSSSHVLSFLDGSNTEATLETAEVTPYGEGRGLTTYVRPVIDTTAALVSVAARETFQATSSYGSEAGLNAIGQAPLRAGGRYHRYKVRVPAGSDWTIAEYVSIEPVSQGRR